MATSHYQLYSTALFLLLLILPATTTATAELCHPQDKKALIKILQSLNSTIATSWWDPSTDCCKTFLQVGCDPLTNRVTFFEFSKQTFAATLPSSIGDLPFLTNLVLHNNLNLTGPIPDSFSNLHHLKFLRLDFNSLTGPIPNFLHTLTNLSNINLSYNLLSGPIPASIALAPSLHFLRLDRNRLTGSIPSTFGSINYSDELLIDLSHNRLTGPIPTSLGNANFTFLNLENNNLTGDASFLFGESKSIMILDLARNSFSFDFSSVVVPPDMESLFVEHNNIFGRLPPSLTDRKSLNFLNVSYNRLCGEIPMGGTLGNFDKFSFFHNKCLCGSPLPPCA